MGAMRSLLNGFHELRRLFRKSGVDPASVRIVIEFEDPRSRDKVMHELRMDQEYTAYNDPLASGEITVDGMKVEFRPRHESAVSARNTTWNYPRSIREETARLLFSVYGGDFLMPRTTHDDWPEFEVIEAKDGG